jgi:hypothetical protein
MTRFDDELSIQRFEAVYREIEDGKQDLNTSIATMHRHFPDPEELDAYFEWVHARAEEAASPGLTADKFIIQVDSIDFLSNDGNELVEAMDKLYSIVVPIGFDGNILYRLLTDPFTLQAHPREDTATPSSDLLLQSYFLGVNPTVQPREPAVPANRRQANLSETSTRSAESDDVDMPGFEFFQLGELEYARRRDGRSGPWNNDDERDLPFGWRKTGFVMVARLGPSRRVDGIYAIYNMWFRDEDEEACCSDDLEPKIITHSYWGIPPTAKFAGGEDQFSCAKLGPRLSSFGKDHQVVWTEKIGHPVELVRVKRSGDGRILRTTVDEKLWPRWSSTESGSES